MKKKKKKITKYILRVESKEYQSEFNEYFLFECQPSDIKKKLVEKLADKIIFEFNSYFIKNRRYSAGKVTGVYVTQTNRLTNYKSFKLVIHFNCICREGEDCHKICKGYFTKKFEICFKRLPSTEILNPEDLKVNAEQYLTHKNKAVREHAKKVMKKIANGKS